MGIFLIVAAVRERCHSAGLGARSAAAHRDVGACLVERHRCHRVQAGSLLSGVGGCWRWRTLTFRGETSLGSGNSRGFHVCPSSCHAHFLLCGVSVGVHSALSVHAGGKLWSSSGAVWPLPR